MSNPTVQNSHNQGEERERPGTKQKVPFLDLRLSETERHDILQSIDRILESGLILNAPEINDFENSVAAYCGVTEAVGVGSGTDALYVALKCLEIGPGDEVVLPALSFVGTANAVAAVGARPVFVDIRNDLLIDPQAVRAACTSHTRAIMPVHFTGAVCDMNELLNLGKQLDVPLIEDAAPAFGATYHGKKAGSFGEFGCISMNPMKPLGAVGEAGVVLTSNSLAAQRLRDLRYHGMVNKDFCADVSLNARIDAIQAAILSIRLQQYDTKFARRTDIAARYSQKLSNLVQVPLTVSHMEPAWYTYSIVCDRRDDLFEALNKTGIECKCYHTRLMPEHPAHLNNIDSFPVGREIVKGILCLPIHEKLSDSQVDYVIKGIQTFYGQTQ